MKISANQLESILKIYAEKSGKSRSKTFQGISSNKGDKISFSQKTLEIREIYRKLQEVPELREQLISEIKDRLSRNEYHVEPAKVVEKMIIRDIADSFFSGGE
jgi:anti-sigma28 factor (negative regulator of flagellin synthesis)